MGKAVHTGADEMDGLATSLRNAADKLEAAIDAYDVALAAAGITIAVGLAATIISFGTSDAAAGAAAGAEVEGAVIVAEEATSAASAALTAALAVARQIVVKFVVFLGVDLTAQAATSAIVYPDHNPFTHLDFKSAILVAGGMALPGAVGGSLTRQVLVNGVIGAGYDAAAQEITTGKIDPVQVLFSGAAFAGFTGITALGGRALAGVLSRAADGSVLPGDGVLDGDLSAPAGEPAPDAPQLRITAVNATAEETRAAQKVHALGHEVVLRDPPHGGGTRGVDTSDLIVDGEQYDIYSPETGNLNRIVSELVRKRSQVTGGGVVLNLENSPLDVTDIDVESLLYRVNNATSGSPPLSNIIVIK